jgi:hypothetical protein
MGGPLLGPILWSLFLVALGLLWLAWLGRVLVGLPVVLWHDIREAWHDHGQQVARDARCLCGAAR